jgi:hypothetical protein
MILIFTPYEFWLLHFRAVLDRRSLRSPAILCTVMLESEEANKGKRPPFQKKDRLLITSSLDER